MASRKGKDVKKYDPSQPVEFTKHEEVVQAYFELNFVKSAAIRAVYGDPNHESTMGSRITQIFGKADVKARMKYLYNLRKSKVIGSSKEDLLEMLLRRASASITDFVAVDYDEAGKPVAIFVPTELVDGQVVDEITIMPTAHGDRVKVKLPDKERTIELIAKLEKLINTDTTVNAFIVDQDDEANKAYRERMKRVADQKAAKPTESEDDNKPNTDKLDTVG